jgi:hypothetical protein
VRGSSSRRACRARPAFRRDPLGEGLSGQNYPAHAVRHGQGPDAAERELDAGKRRGLFADIQRKRDLPVLPLFFRVDPFVIHSR